MIKATRTNKEAPNASKAVVIMMRFPVFCRALLLKEPPIEKAMNPRAKLLKKEISMVEIMEPGLLAVPKKKVDSPKVSLIPVQASTIAPKQKGPKRMPNKTYPVTLGKWRSFMNLPASSPRNKKIAM